MSSVTEIIRAQHRDFAQVLKALETIANGPLEERRSEDLAQLFDICHYARVFPDKLHHPDEEQYVFGPLRDVAPDHREMIDEIRAEHDRADSLTGRLHDGITAFDKNQCDAETLRHTIRTYLDFQFEHMRKEENTLLPLVEHALEKDQYHAATRAFAKHADPLFSENVAAGFEALKRRIESRV